MQAVELRERQLNIRLSEDEAARLAAVCDHLGINAANLFRMMLREKARELGVEPVAPSVVTKTSRAKAKK